MPSRRHSLQTGSVVRAMMVLVRLLAPLAPEAEGEGDRRSGRLDSAFLGRPAAVVRQGGDVLDGLDVQAGRLQGGDGGFASRAGPLDADLDLLEAELGGLLSGDLGG